VHCLTGDTMVLGETVVAEGELTDARPGGLVRGRRPATVGWAVYATGPGGGPGECDTTGAGEGVGVGDGEATGAGECAGAGDGEAAGPGADPGPCACAGPGAGDGVGVADVGFAGGVSRRPAAKSTA
jgi:hypothetical protein